MRRTFAVLVLAMASGLLFPAAAGASAPSTVTCSLSEAADGNLAVTVTGLAPDTFYYGYYIDAPLPDGTVPSVSNGLFGTDSTGGATFEERPVADLMGEFPGETYLVFTVYPGNKYPRHGNRDGGLASCTFIPA